jgi:putative aldouronate transport system permease protein
VKKTGYEAALPAGLNTAFVRSEVRPKNKILTELSKNRYLYILSIPVFLYFIIFCYVPMAGIIIAFKQFDIGKGIDGIISGKWVGLKYFYDFFKSVDCFRIIRNTFLISFYDLVFGFPVPVIFALMINEIRGKFFKKAVQTVTYMPYFISLVVMCGIITDFFSTNGIMTKLLTSFGLETKNYIGDANAFRPIFVGTNIWQGFGWGSIIYLAALAGINQELYEAANVDGAGKWKQLWVITLPCISSTIIVMLILRVGQLMNVGYEKIILLYGAGTYETADVISSFVYRRGMGAGAQYSFTAAVGLFQSVINLILLVSANFVSSRYSSISLFK